ncbi:MAG: glycosyltransferase family 39 protein [Chloroflexi bacterium]|nr:glycosyltransferase family 39 protein [Chloroflexota bacterium]
MQASQHAPGDAAHAFVEQHMTAINVLGACLVIVVCAAAMRWQPLVTDEHMIFRAAADWYRLRTLHVHPQLFIHWIQLCFLLFGRTVDAARIAMLLPNLATVATIPWLARLVYQQELGRADSRAIGILAIWLFALCPLTIQNSILIDSDSSLLMLALTLMLCLWFAMRQRPAWQQVLLLGIGFAVCLWIKLTTPPMLVAALALYCLLRRQWRQALVVIGFAIMGLLLFLATHSVYSALTGFTLADASAGLSGHFGGAFGGLTTILTRAPQSLGVFIFWLGPAYALWLVTALFPSAMRLLRNRLNAEDALIIFSLIVIVAYTLFVDPAWGYPRYYSPALPLMAIVASAYLLAHVARLGSHPILRLSAILAVTAIYLLLIVGDPVYALYQSTFDTTALSTRLRIGGIAFAKLVVPLLLALPAAWLAAPRLALSRTSLTLAVLAALTIGFDIATNLVQVSAGYSTRFRYTQVYADRQRAIDLVERSVPPGGYTLTDPDILYFANRPGEEIFTYISVNRDNPLLLIDALKTRRVEAIAWTDKEWMKAPALRNDPTLTSLLDNCYQKHTFGVFTVLLRHDAAACTGLP